MKNRVVITGGGVVSALGNSWQAVSARLQRGENAVRYMTEWDRYQDLGTRLAAPVDEIDFPDRYGKKLTRSMGRVARLGVAASYRAVEQAGLLDDPVLGNGDTGVCYGSAAGSSDAAMEFFDLLHSDTTARINGTTYLRMMSHSAAINISVCFGTTGRMQTTSTACTAGSQGIGFACESIRSGQQQVMIAGGAEELCPAQAAVFDTVFAASRMNDRPERSPRPFDRHRDGLVLGEGACTLILENRDHALERNAEILGEVVGFATNTDGRHIVRPNPVTMARVMTMALADAGVDPSRIGYISAHGTGTEQGDIVEVVATSEVMGSKVPTSSLKSYTGHTLGACGAFELWASLMMMRDGWVAPTLNLDQVDPLCAGLEHVTNAPRELSTDLVMSNNFAFGGVNTSLIIAGSS